MRRQICVLILAASPGLCGAEESASILQATTREPRAFGYQVGDIVARSITVHVPEGLVLDETSVPHPGARGRAIELRRVARRDRSEPGGRRHELTLDYQLMLSPPQPRTFELPTLMLRFQGRPRAQELRIEAWPVTVSPLVPVDVSPRRGLGELQPDTPPPLIDTSATHGRLIAYAVASLLLLAYLAYIYIGLPWWSRAHRPFTQAWRSLRDLRADSAEGRWHEAIRQVHEALNRTAGEVVFEHGIDRFVGAHDRFEPMRGELLRFFQLSRRAFFADDALATADRTWLIEFSRRCRDAERGAA
jgi:mxaA protein